MRINLAQTKQSLGCFKEESRTNYDKLDSILHTEVYKF